VLGAVRTRKSGLKKILRNCEVISVSQKCRLRKGQNQSEKLLVCVIQPAWRRQRACGSRTQSGGLPKVTIVTDRRAVSSLGRAKNFGTP
jgi:hypothetical protein